MRGATAASGGAGLVARARAGAGSAWGAATAPGSARAAAGGAARFLGPTALLMGLMAAAGPGMNFGQRTQAALSLGGLNPLVAMPMTDQQRSANTGGAAQKFIGGLPQGAGVGAQRQAVSSLQTGIETAAGRDELGDASPYEYAEALRQELKLRREILKATIRGKREEGDRRSVIRARGIMEDLGKAFDIRSQTKGPEAAMEDTVGAMLEKLAHLRPAGRRVLGENTLAWARQMAQDNPRLASIVENLEDRIVRSYRRMGKRVQIVNGEIFEGTKSEWKRIRTALTSETEQARQEAMEDFTAIQQQAVGSLRAMGFSAAEARTLVSSTEKGGKAASFAGVATDLGPDNPVSKGITTGLRAADRANRKRSRGGRLPGQGLQDNVPMADGGYGAPGEPVLNRHTERDIDAYLAEHGQSVDSMMRGEYKRHSHPPTGLPRRGRTARGVVPFEMNAAFGGRLYRGGGRVGSRTKGRGGGAVQHAGGYDALVSLGRQLQGQGFAVGEHPLFGGVAPGAHSATGYHYQDGGLALDINADSFPQGEDAALSALARQLTAAGWHILWHVADHYDHLHVDTAAGGGGPVSGVGTASSGTGGAPQQIDALKAPDISARGLPGALVGAATKPYAAALTDKLNAKLRKRGGGGAGGFGTGAFKGGGDVRGWLTEALRITGMFSEANLDALAGRAMQESGGDPNAQNNWDSNAAAGTPSIGLLQTIGPTFSTYSMPGMKNIRNPVHNAVAAIRYMMARYGHIVGPGGGGYDLGGRIPEFAGWNAKGLDRTFKRPTLVGVGERGNERVTVTPSSGSGARSQTVSGPLVVLNDGAIRIDGGGDSEKVRMVVREELDHFADLIVEEINDGPQEREDVD